MDKLKRIKKSKAFTFIELSITLLVISILAFVIIGGSKSLFSSSSLARARAITINSPVTKIDGLVAWYETTLPESFPASQATDGTQITEWRSVAVDSIVTKKNVFDSAVAKDLAEIQKKNILTKTADSTVTYVKKGINSLPSIKFSGQGTNISNTKIATLSSFSQGTFLQTTIFVVFSSSTTYSTYYRVLTDSGPAGSNAANEVRTGVRQSNEVYLDQGGTGTLSTSTTLFTTNSSYILTSYLNGSQARAYVNSANTATTTTNVSNGLLNGITVGARYDGAYRCDCVISEVIVYNRPLNLDERKAVVSYLSKKYNISVTGL